MARRTGRCRLVALAMLAVVYGMVLPMLFANPVGGHDYAPHAVRNNRLDVYNAMEPQLQCSSMALFALREWNGYADNVTTAFTTSTGNAEVTLFTRCARRSLDMGQYDPRTKTIVFNSCLLDHPGGRFSRLGTFGPTPASRRARTFVHEIGPALGLDHTDSNPALDHTQSIMSIWYTLSPRETLSSFYKTKNLLRKHDKDDIKDRW